MSRATNWRMARAQRWEITLIISGLRVRQFLLIRRVLRLIVSEDLVESSKVELQQLSQEFRQRLRAFVPMPIHFDGVAASRDEPCPPPPYKLNRAFLEHQDWMLNLLERIDAIQSHGDASFREQRRSLTVEIQEHEAFLDAEISHAWHNHKARSAKSTGAGSIFPDVVDTCE